MEGAGWMGGWSGLDGGVCCLMLLFGKLGLVLIFPPSSVMLPLDANGGGV